MIMASPYPHGRWTPRIKAQEPGDAFQRVIDNEPAPVDPGDCKHDWFGLGNGRFRCKWCGLVLVDDDPDP